VAESARHLVDEVFGPRPVRQWVLSVPVPLRFLFASKPETIGSVLGIVHRVIAGWLAAQAGVERSTAQCGAVTLIQRFGSALNLTNSLQANLCAKREVARAADSIGARETSACGRGIDCGQQRPPQPRRKAPLDDL